MISVIVLRIIICIVFFLSYSITDFIWKQEPRFGFFFSSFRMCFAYLLLINSFFIRCMKIVCFIVHIYSRKKKSTQKYRFFLTSLRIYSIINNRLMTKIDNCNVKIIYLLRFGLPGYKRNTRRVEVEKCEWTKYWFSQYS